MANIDSLEFIKRLDQDNMLGHIQEFPAQCEKSWQDWQKIPLPARFIQAKSILICGMGGSAIGGGLVASIVPRSRVPIIVWRDYGIPGWVNKDTLVIAVSYSGDTEETLNCLKKAALKTDKFVTISSGGELESLSRKYKSVHFKIGYDSQPRAALGFQLISMLAIFDKLDLIEISDEDFREALLLLKGLQKKIDVNVPTPNNNAKLLAKKLEGKIPVIYGAGTLSEVARRWKGEFNENAKTASYFEILPEVNHNAMVGLEFPKELKNKIFTIILESKFDHPRNTFRENITLQILQRRRIPVETVRLEPAPTPLSELLQVIHFGDYVSYYLAIINEVSPTPVDIIGFLKDKLAEKPIEESF